MAEGSELSVTGTTVARNRAAAVLPLPSVIPPPARPLAAAAFGARARPVAPLPALSLCQDLSPRFSFLGSGTICSPAPSLGPRAFESLMVRVTGRGSHGRLREVRLCPLRLPSSPPCTTLFRVNALRFGGKIETIVARSTLQTRTFTSSTTSSVLIAG